MGWDFNRLAGEAYEDPQNYISAEEAISPELAGLRIYDVPIFGVGDAADPMFEEMLISFFLPYSLEIKKSNETKRSEPSFQWLHGRYEGQRFLLAFAQRLRAELEDGGEKALVPVLQKEFAAVEHADRSYEPFGPGVCFTSNWSERHVAYICGLGTFSLSKAVITEKGICGRFGSVVTTALLPVTRRKYAGLYEYCSFCGACVKNCPACAISLKDGKMHPPCSAFLDMMRTRYAPRYGCGKCQVKVPCRDHIPSPKR